MRTLATKQPTHDSAKQQKGDRGRTACSSTSRSCSVSPLPTGMPLLQRKCACGGGCPRCQAEQDLEEALPIQTKVKISQPGDKYEQEADRIAEQVMRMPEPRVSESETTAQVRKETIQTKSATGEGSTDSLAVSLSIISLQSGGQPLSQSEREFFEPRFGIDLSQVRIHADSRATETAQSLNARAFTIGRDIVFGTGQYEMGSTEGRQLLAHELTHTIQQGYASDKFLSSSPRVNSIKKDLIQCSGECSPPVCEPNLRDEVQSPPTPYDLAADLEEYGVLRSTGSSRHFANILWRHLTDRTPLGQQYNQFLDAEYPISGFCISYGGGDWNNTFRTDLLQGCYRYRRSRLRYHELQTIAATVKENALDRLEIFDETGTPLTDSTLNDKPAGTILKGPPATGILLLMATDRFLSSLSLTAAAVSATSVPTAASGTISSWRAIPRTTGRRGEFLDRRGFTLHRLPDLANMPDSYHQSYGDPNRFDDLIVYWTNYYNERFLPLDSRGNPNPLDPNLVKAMIHEESRFYPQAGFVPRRGHFLGLLQVGSEERRTVSQVRTSPPGQSPVGITGINTANFSDEALQISTGIRTLFEKYRHRRVRGRWEMAVELYNSRSSYRPRVMAIYRATTTTP